MRVNVYIYGASVKSGKRAGVSTLFSITKIDNTSTVITLREVSGVHVITRLHLLLAPSEWVWPLECECPQLSLPQKNFYVYAMIGSSRHGEEVSRQPHKLKTAGANPAAATSSPFSCLSLVLRFKPVIPWQAFFCLYYMVIRRRVEKICRVLK